MLGSRLAGKHYTVGIVSSGGVLEEDFKRNGILVYNFPMKTKSELHPKLLLALPRVVRVVRDEGFELLHAHTRVTQVLAFFVSKITGVPFVSTAHGFYRPRLGRRLFGFWGSRVIAISPPVAEDLEKSHGVDPKKIRLVLNAIDIEKSERGLAGQDCEAIRREWGIPVEARVVGSISRLVRDKGHEYLIEAVARLKHSHPNIFLLILGEGRERDNLQRRIADLGLGSQARILSVEKDVTKALVVMDIFAHPATFREGFGLSIAEAMIARIPVVATNIWALNSIIQDGVNGYLVEPKNTDALMKAIRFILENPKNAQDVADRAYQTAAKLCSLDRMVNEIERVYEEVVIP